MITGNEIPELVDFTIEERYGRESKTMTVLRLVKHSRALVDEPIDIGEMVAQTLGVSVSPWPKSQASADILIE